MKRKKKIVAFVLTAAFLMQTVMIPGGYSHANEIDLENEEPVHWEILGGAPRVATGSAVSPASGSSISCTAAALADIDAAIEKARAIRVVGERTYGIMDFADEYMSYEDYLVDKETDIIKNTDYKPQEDGKANGYEDGKHPYWFDCCQQLRYRYVRDEVIDGNTVPLYAYKGINIKHWDGWSYDWSKRRGGSKAYVKDDATIFTEGTPVDCYVRTLIPDGTNEAAWQTKGDYSTEYYRSVDYYIGKSDGLIRLVIEKSTYDEERKEGNCWIPSVVYYPTETLEQVPEEVTARANYENNEWVKGKDNIDYRSVFAYPYSYAKAKHGSIDKKTKKIVIPDTIAFERWELPVEVLGTLFMIKQYKVKTVKLGKNVKTIENKAFWKSPELKKVILGKSTEEIGNNAFGKCPKMAVLDARKADLNLQCFLKNDSSFRKAIGLNPSARILTKKLPKKGSAKLNKKKMTLLTGRTAKLILKKATGPVRYRTTDGRIAFVSEDGTITANAAGKVKIYVFNQGARYVCNLTVKPVKKGYADRKKLVRYIRDHGKHDDEFEIFEMPDYNWRNSDGEKNYVHIHVGDKAGDDVKFLSTWTRKEKEEFSVFAYVTIFFNESGSASLIFESAARRKGDDESVNEDFRLDFDGPVSDISAKGTYDWHEEEPMYVDSDYYGYFTADEYKKLADQAVQEVYDQFNAALKKKMKTEFTMSGLGFGA